MIYVFIRFWRDIFNILIRSQIIIAMKKIVALVFSVGMLATTFAAPVIPNANAREVQEKVYNKIEAKDVPAEILKEITEKYPGYTVNTAFKSEDGSDYKLVLGKDTTSVTVFYNAKGEFEKEQK